MPTPHMQDHNANVYLTVTVSQSSPLYQNPNLLACHSALTHVGQVGQLRDVQLLSVPRGDWDHVQGDVFSALNSLQGVRRVDVQDPPRLRAKRDEADL